MSMSVPIDIRFSNVSPPAPEPKRSIYSDLVNLPNPVYLNLTVRIFNLDDVTLYMRVDGYDAAWTFTSNNLGSLASGADMYRNLDHFGSRAKPGAATSEQVTVRLRAYTDAGYTILKWTFERVIDIVFIKSDDGSWTQDFLDNFDDGTVQGWTAVNETGNTGAYPTLAASTTYALSLPYALRMRQGQSTTEKRARMYKSFTTPNRANVFAILDVRADDIGYAGPKIKYLIVGKNGDILVYYGRPYDTSGVDYVPEGVWLRYIVPLPKNTTLEVRVITDWEDNIGQLMDTWMDDFRIISKD